MLDGWTGRRIRESRDLVAWAHMVLDRGDFDEIAGTYAFFSLNHGGQNSWSYKALCVLGEEFHPAGSWSESDLTEAESEAFDAAAEIFGGGPDEGPSSTQRRWRKGFKDYEIPERIHLGAAPSPCSGDSIPEVKLALEKSRCLKGVKREFLRTAGEISNFLMRHYSCLAQEQFLALGFNARNELLGVLDVGRGGLDSLQVDPRVVFSGMILMGASALVLAHTHPGGDSSPSPQDFDLTRQLKTSAQLLAIRLLDHIIIGSSGETFSMLQQGVLP